mgnify:CR=1 FL=1
MGLPRIIVTGSSGFIGRHLLDALKEDYRIYALARRSRKANHCLRQARIYSQFTSWGHGADLLWEMRAAAPDQLGNFLLG